MCDESGYVHEKKTHGDYIIEYITYSDERQLYDLKNLLEKDLSEPYSIFTYRGFVQEPRLTILAFNEDELVGAVMCKIDRHKSKAVCSVVDRCYLGMIAVKDEYRKLKIGSHLVCLSCKVGETLGAHEMALETECVNKAAIALYERLGFVVVKYLRAYYLNYNDAIRMRLILGPKSTPEVFSYWPETFGKPPEGYTHTLSID
eukprot:GHVR01045494.1.p1 GENE.GHVR01045494.1~~GHVR01045494.1.p1  ORF type:complete len:202 (-),score=32.75 GHVR01045494.1:103-708(-)